MRLKTILIAAAGVILVIIVSAVVVLRSIDFNEYKSLVVERVKAATGREPKIGGNLDLRVGFSPAVVVEDVSLANAPWGSRPDMVRVRRFEMEVALLPLIFRDIRIKRLVLVQPDILLETDARGIGNWSMGETAALTAPPATKPGENTAGLAAIAVREVRIEKGILTYRDGRTKRATSLVVDRLDLRAKDAASPLAIDLAAVYDGKAFTIAGTVGRLRELLAPSHPYPVKLSLQAGGASLVVDGRIAKPMEAAGLDVKVTARGQELAEVAGFAGQTVPAIGPFAATAQVSGSPQALSVSNMYASVGKSSLAGSGTISIGGPRPKITGRLASPLLDLVELFPGGGASQRGAAPSQKGPEPGREERMFSADPLPLGVLKVVDADLDLKVERLVLPNKLSVEALDTRLVLSGGRLHVQPLSTRIGGGTVTGRIALDVSAGKTAILEAKIDAKAIDLGQMLRQMGKPDLVTGTKTDIALDLRGSGSSIRELMAGLNGGMLLVLGEGKIYTKFVEWLGGDLLTQIAEKVNPFRKTDPYTELKCGVIGFVARDGMATTDKGIGFETSRMTLVSSGTVNLKTEAIDFSLRPETRQVVGIGAGELVKLLRLRGTLAEPRYGIDEVETAKRAASIGAAVMTVGLSFLAETLAKLAMADPHPCETALAKTAATAKTWSASSGAAPSGKGAPEQENGIGQLFQGLFGK